MDAFALTEAMTRIPSWRSGDTEIPLATWLTEYMQRELPWVPVHHQSLDRGRFNIITGDGEPTRLLFAGHLDTLPVGDGWTHAPLGERVGDRFYGRGALDMKGGIAAFLTAIQSLGRAATHGVAMLLYCDEEYEFEGMQRYLAAYDHHPHPELVICPEPTNLHIRNGCRGLVETRVAIRGRSGHAARPTSGRSAYDALATGIHALDQLLQGHAHAAFGVPTRNIAFVRVGQLIGKDADGGALLGDRGNVIPDYAEAVLEVRTVPGIDADDCVGAFTGAVEAAGGVVESVVTKFDFRSYFVPRAALIDIDAGCAEVLGNATYDNLGVTGYSDIQLLADRWNVPCTMLGPRGANAHAADEYVDIESLAQLVAVFETIIRRCTGVVRR